MSLLQAIVIPSHPKFSTQRDYRLWIYRGDLEHPAAPGNKWHKLKYHLEAARQQGATALATFGGPYSNHLHAFANVIADSAWAGICVVRGELQAKLTPTLADAAQAGVVLWPSTRADYRLAEAAEVVATINANYPSVYWIPEGGGGVLGARGCQDWAQQIGQHGLGFDAWAVSAGTGTTAAGFLAASQAANLHVFSALKGATAQQQEIVALAQQINPEARGESLVFHSDCHHGGYAKHSPELAQFMQQIAQLNPHLLLDPVYTCKSLFAIISKMQAGTWPHQSTLFVHTGGLQGWRGYPDEVNPFAKALTHSDS